MAFYTCHLDIGEDIDSVQLIHFCKERWPRQVYDLLWYQVMDRNNYRKYSLYIGWDVGGWNCERNGKSRDALVILDGKCELVGKPWRGNLRNTINDASNSSEWIKALLDLCQVIWQGSELPTVVLAIDTPLGFSESFRNLIAGKGAVESIEDSETNPYLFRYTERFLFQRGLKPLSAVKDMIGSQATKGMHALAKFSPRVKSVGVWQDEGNLQAIEAYPSACKHSGTMGSLLQSFIVEQEILQLPLDAHWQGATFVPGIDHDDKRDALICALLAWLYTNEPGQLEMPPAETPRSEGWIFVPKDGLDMFSHM